MKEVNNLELDESLYSRQLYAIGKDAMHKMTKSSVLICCASNLSGLAVEVAKCIILAGVKNVSIYAKTDILTYKDIASNYYAHIDDIGKPFLQKVIKNLASLNSNVCVDNLKYLTQSSIKKYDCAVFCDYNIYDLLFWNRICRENKIKFIMLQTYGLAGNIFCDFDTIIIDDIDGEPLRSGMIAKIQDNKFISVEPHKLYTGDIIEFFGIINNNRDSNQYLVKVITSFEFQIHEFKNIYKQYSPEELQIEIFRSKPIFISNNVPQNLVFNQIKLPAIMKFKSLEDSLLNPDFVRFDTEIWDMPKILNVFMKALNIWMLSNRFIFDEDTYVDNVWNTFPVNNNDYIKLKKYFDLEMRLSCKTSLELKYIDKIFYQLAMTCSGRICGVDSVIGALGAQEVIKAISNKFTPTKQFLHFEALNILPDDYVIERKKSDKLYLHVNSRYDGQIKVFGKDYMDALHCKKVFVVGAGAIGCEHIKNFSMMGINNITITDMDHIEISNLNRQFLFTWADIGQSKSVTVAKKAKLINSDTIVKAQENKVCKETANIYNSKFFQEFDVIANALDNTEARLFVDSLCVKYNKPLLESGTLGTKGSIQCIIPDLTDSYGSLKDPPEQNIALCTLKLFPYKFEHFIQYARDIFEGFFNRIPSNLMKARDIDALKQMAPSDLAILYEDIKTITQNYKNFKYCINIAYKQWHILFRDVINQLIKKYPKDHKDEDNNLFWSGNKIFPRSAFFDTSDENDINFVIYFAHIWADMLNIPQNKRYAVTSYDKYKTFLSRFEPPSEVLCKDVSQNNSEKSVDDDINTDTIINSITQLIASTKDSLQIIKQIEFEKDNDSNHHIDFIVACSNKRAYNYYIESKDRYTIKGIAGKIIPAIATTTSVVSGLISLEMYKVFYCNLLEKDIDRIKKYKTCNRFRYGSFNMAIQLFGFSESYPAKLVNINNKYYSIWTKDNVDPDMTLNQFIASWENVTLHCEKNLTMEIDLIASDTGIIYSNMNDNEDIKCKTFRDIIKEMKVNEQFGDYYFTLSLEEVLVDDDDNLDDNNNLNDNITIGFKVTI